MQDAPCPKRTQDVAAAIGGVLEPRYIIGAQSLLTSELLRTLSRVAASKPTSWLSSRLHILST